MFFLSDRGFMALEDGECLKPIGNEKFDQTFRDTVSQDDYEKLWSAVDPKRSLVMWGLPGTPGRIWVYNWVLDRASTIETPFAGLFTGYNSLTLEQVSAAYPNLDTMPYSLDYTLAFRAAILGFTSSPPTTRSGALSGPGTSRRRCGWGGGDAFRSERHPGTRRVAHR
ncbi:hypothetical protein AB5I41_31480 [Sphingomonas sp. MMS24-JH45]